MNLNCKSAVLAGLLALQGCSTVVERTEGWPESLPAREYFSQVYEADVLNAAAQTEEQYLIWVRRFYEGSELYAWGYLDLESLVLDGMEGAAAVRLKRKLDAVGLQIGAEWAKHRSERLVNTGMLSVWADAIQSAAASGQSEAVTDRISADLTALLSGELPEAAIGPDRYGSSIALAFGDD